MEEEKTTRFRSFVATDKSGNGYKVFMLQRVTYFRTPAACHRVDGDMVLMTEEGELVTYLSRGRYQVHSNEPVQVSSGDPCAP